MAESADAISAAKSAGSTRRAAGSPLPPFLKVKREIAISGSRAERVRGFTIEKQESFDLCWAAVTVSAARFRGIAGAADQWELVTAYAQAPQRACPCSARPGQNGLMLWCVDCAFQMVGIKYQSLTGLPTFDALCILLDQQKPICALRNYSTGAHYVVLVGGYSTQAGAMMVTIADPDPGQPDLRDIAYRELLEGDGRAIALYQF